MLFYQRFFNTHCLISTAALRLILAIKNKLATKLVKWILNASQGNALIQPDNARAALIAVHRRTTIHCAPMDSVTMPSVLRATENLSMGVHVN